MPETNTVLQSKAAQPINRMVVFFIVAAALLMMTLDSTIVATALHTLEHELHTSINWAGWVITAYALGFVIMLPISGKLSERYGERRVFLASVVTFSIASLGCGFADNIYILIALRALQAAGGAGITPAATGIIVKHFGSGRDRAVSLFGTIFPTGAMIGPIFGGLIVTYWSWQWIFFVNVPIGIMVVILALLFIPKDHVVSRVPHQTMDPIGITLVGVGLLSGMLAASYIGEYNASVLSPLFIGPAIITIMAFWAFFRHINRVSEPFIKPRLIYGPGFGAINLITMVCVGMAQGIIALIPLYAADRYGINALDAGTLLIAEGIAAIGFSIIATLALRRSGYRLPLHIGGGIIAAGIFLLALPPAFGMTPYAWLAMATFLVGVGAGTFSPASRNAGLQLAVEHSEIIAALRTIDLQIGTIITISIATAVIAVSHDSSAAQAWFHIATFGAIVAAQFFISRVPEHRGRW